MSAKPTVGRIVHFYSEAIANCDPLKPGYGLNGQGAGPYPAIVLQVMGDGHYSNLRVFGWGNQGWDEGSVSKGQGGNSRYWEWPPR